MGDREELAELRRIDELQARAHANRPPIETPAFEKEAATNFIRTPLQSMASDFSTGFKGAFGGAGDVLSLPEHAAYQAGGKVTDLTGSPAAGYATNLATQIIPNVVGAPLRLGANGVRGGAEWLMRSALKPNPAAGYDRGQAAVRAMLDRGTNPALSGTQVSRGGVESMRRMLGTENSTAANEIAGSSAQIGKSAVASRLGDTEQRFMAQVNPQSDLQAIENADTAFMMHPQLVGQTTMPVQLAQQLKQGTYRQLRDKYGQMGSAETEAQKALARGLREEIERAVPGVVEPNARAAALANALNVLERRTAVAGNKDPIGLGSLAANPMGTAAFAASRSEYVKSLLARLLNDSQGVPGTVAGGAMGAYMGQPER